MPITVDEILQHRSVHEIYDFVQNMDLKEYAHALQSQAVVFVDSHGFLVDSISGTTLAADGEQLTLLIEYLEIMRDELPETNLKKAVKK